MTNTIDITIDYVGIIDTMRNAGRSDDEINEYISSGRAARDAYEAHEDFIEQLEERQENSGFYAFQDLMDMRRRER